MSGRDAAVGFHNYLLAAVDHVPVSAAPGFLVLVAVIAGVRVGSVRSPWRK